MQKRAPTRLLPLGLVSRRLSSPSRPTVAISVVVDLARRALLRALTDADGVKGTREKGLAKAKPKLALHPDFAAALEKNKAAKTTLDGFAPSYRREYLEWIVEAKRDATREKRILQAIEWLAEGKKRHWKYEDC